MHAAGQTTWYARTFPLMRGVMTQRTEYNNHVNKQL